MTTYRIYGNKEGKIITKIVEANSPVDAINTAMKKGLPKKYYTHFEIV